MRQQILCTECATERRSEYPHDNPYPDEYIKFVDGFAKTYYVCDFCMVSIPKYQPCTAFSSWIENEENTGYIDWESNSIYIAPNTNDWFKYNMNHHCLVLFGNEAKAKEVYVKHYSNVCTRENASKMFEELKDERGFFMMQLWKLIKVFGEAMENDSNFFLCDLFYLQK